MSTISSFSSRFKGGVRANQFTATIAIPPGIGQMGPDFSFHCKGTSIPASTIGNIPVPFLGRQLMVPGDRTYADWTVTVFNDVTMDIRHTFEGWMAQLQNHGANFQNSTKNEDVYGMGTVTQLNRTGKAISSYSIEIYPTEVAAIDLAWDSNDAVEEYAVTFAVNHWVAGPGTVSTASGSDPKWGVEVRADSGGNVGADIWASMKI